MRGGKRSRMRDTDGGGEKVQTQRDRQRDTQRWKHRLRDRSASRSEMERQDARQEGLERDRNRKEINRQKGTANAGETEA